MTCDCLLMTANMITPAILSSPLRTPIAGGRTRDIGTTLADAIAFASRNAGSSVAVTAENAVARVSTGRGHGWYLGCNEASITSWPTTEPGKELFGALADGVWTWKVNTYSDDKLVDSTDVDASDIQL